MNKKGFTLVEIMVVVAIIGILAAIAVPNFLAAQNRARDNSCLSTIALIERTLAVAAADGNFAAGRATADADIDAFFPGGATPLCPVDGGAYLHNAGTYANPNITCDGH